MRLTDKFFFSGPGLSQAYDDFCKITAQALQNADDGELFLEYREQEALSFESGQIRNAAHYITGGMGLRTVEGEAVSYAHTNDLSVKALLKASEIVRAAQTRQGGIFSLYRPDILPQGKALYSPENPLSSTDFTARTALLQEIDDFARAQSALVRQVLISLNGEYQVISLIRNRDSMAEDLRPLVSLRVTVILEKDGRQESGAHALGGRYGYQSFFNKEVWQEAVLQALRQAKIKLSAKEAPAGETDVILGPGWTGILLHEAVGHGLEGDFNRKKLSVFSDKIGQRIAAPGVTVIDDGTLFERRGSLTVDDEGTPTARTTLIEDGILQGYMQDRMSARLTGTKPTGNGRRQSYAHPPLVRMTNTFMQGGTATREEMIASVKKGILALDFGGGQVDITSGKFVFEASEAYLIENGKVGSPVRGAALIGSGEKALLGIDMIGQNMMLDNGLGTCGKDGQSVPVGVGLPDLKICGLTVGGTG